jgi:hypothetical protein
LVVHPASQLGVLVVNQVDEEQALMVGFDHEWLPAQ